MSLAVLKRTVFHQQLRQFAVTGRKSKNVQGKKNKNDARIAKLFNRLAIRILIAAKAGGTNPATNAELSRALKEAHSAKVPKENVERALSRATDNSGSGEGYKSGVYEIFGFGGVGIVCTSLTDNPTRAVKTIKAAVNKVDCKMASSGSIVFRFMQKGLLEVNTNYDSDEVLELGVEANLDDVDFMQRPPEDDKASLPPWILVPTTQLNLMQDALQSKGLDSTGKFVFLPKELIVVSDEDKERNNELIETLEDLEDVDEVFHDMA